MRSFITCTLPKYNSNDQVMENEIGTACSTHGCGEEYIWNFCGNTTKKRSLGRLRRIWVDNIKMDLREEGAVLTGLIWLRIGISGGVLRTR
jgi:hypothetical protein